MMKSHSALSKRLVLLCFLLLLTGVAVVWASDAVAVPTATTIERWVIAGGGGHAEADPYALDGTVGQAVVGTSDQTPYSLCSGFWCGVRGGPAERIFLPVVVRDH
jgi:hypothetical protein